MSEAELELHLIRKLPTTMANALDELERDQLLMEAMSDLMRRSYLAVRRSEEKAFSEQGSDLRFVITFTSSSLPGGSE